MSTVIKDKHGKVIKSLPDTQYHSDGTGARDADGNRITDVVPEAAVDAAKPTATSKKDADK